MKWINLREQFPPWERDALFLSESSGEYWIGSLTLDKGEPIITENRSDLVRSAIREPGDAYQDRAEPLTNVEKEHGRVTSIWWTPLTPPEEAEW